MTDTDLAGVWRLCEDVKDIEAPCPIPGDAVSALVAAGRIPEPYLGRNELECRWVAAADWTLRRSFDVPATDDGIWILEAEGLDTVAEVSIDGTNVLQAANAFRRWRVALPADVMTAGSHAIAIHYPSALEAADARQAAQPVRIPYNEDNCPLPNGNMLRKQQCDFGWDWNIALAPFGITGGIQLRHVARALPGAVRVHQTHGETDVTVKVEVTVDRFAEGPVPYAVNFNGERREGIVAAHSDTTTETFKIADPKLWWPAGWGDQFLYDLTTEVDGRRENRRIGLREIALVSEPDEAGRSFGLRVNGRNLFVRGANWIPADALSGRITQDGVCDLLTSAVAANMNMLRVWGGGRYEPDWFHDMCDELGLLIWQDAMFSCHLYPSDDVFLDDVAAEVTAQATRLQHHASTALWCGDNELIGALTWYPESIADRDRYLVSYDRLNRTIEAAVRRGDPGVGWWPSSPSPGPMAFGDAWHEHGSGDMHFWSVWHEGRDFDHYRDVAPRFASEFGFQSYPSIDVIRAFAKPADENIASPVMEHHQKNAGGNARIAETMFRYFRWPEAFEDFVWLSQIQQGLAIKTAVTHWRSLKPHCMGTLYWQLNDTWPCASWSSLNHGGSWKMLHHMARRFQAPVIVTVVPDGDDLRCVAINDGLDTITLTLRVRAMGMDGQLRDLQDKTAQISPDKAVELPKLPANVLAPDEMIVIDWDGPHPGRDLYAPNPWKLYDLPAASLSSQVSHSAGDWCLDLSVKAPAFFSTAEADVPGRWSDAALPLLLPGEACQLHFKPTDPGAAVNFKLRDLHSATYPKVKA